MFSICAPIFHLGYSNTDARPITQRHRFAPVVYAKQPDFSRHKRFNSKVYFSAYSRQTHAHTFINSHAKKPHSRSHIHQSQTHAHILTHSHTQRIASHINTLIQQKNPIMCTHQHSFRALSYPNTQTHVQLIQVLFAQELFPTQT